MLYLPDAILVIISEYVLDDNLEAYVNLQSINTRFRDAIPKKISVKRTNSILTTLSPRTLDLLQKNEMRRFILVNCKKFTDILPLNTVHTLDLSHCRKIVDVSALKKYTLSR